MKQGTGRILLALIASVWLGPLLGCAKDGFDSPTSSDSQDKKKRTILLSTEYDDLGAGQEAAQEVEAELGLYEDAALNAYVSRIGTQLVQHAAPRPFQYEFQILDQMTPNAFSLPGGHIYLSRGLIALAQDDDELANVLGHEIIHAADRHAAAQQELARRTNPFLMPFVRMARLAAYSRDHERSADSGGQALAAKAGYDPTAMARFLKNLGNNERLTIGYSRLTSYFDTHPGTTERVASTAAHADTLAWTRDPTRRNGRSIYLQHIDGVILDTNPAEGIFRETEFIHPDLDFRMLFPRGWALVNTHQAVGAISPDGNARVFITLESPKQPPEDTATEPEGTAAPPTTPPEMPTPKEAAERLAQNDSDEFDISVESEQSVRLGETEAYRLDIEGRIAGVSVIGQIIFVEHEGFVFRLTSVAASSSWSRYQGRIHTAARTFRRLSEEERESVEVLHLGVVRALDGENLASLSQRTGNAWPPGRTAVLNGVFIDVLFEEGQLVKIARSALYEAKRRESEPQAPDSIPGANALEHPAVAR